MNIVLTEDMPAGTYALVRVGSSTTVTTTDAAAGTGTAVGPVLIGGNLPPAFDQAWNGLLYNGGLSNPVTFTVYAASFANQASPGEREVIRSKLGKILGSLGLPPEFMAKPYSFVLQRVMYPSDPAFMTPDEIAAEKQKAIDRNRGE